MGIGELRHVHKGHGANLVPAAVGIQAARMIASGGLVIRMIILNEKRSVLRQRIHHTASQLIASPAVICNALGIECLTGSIACILIHGIKIPIGIHAAHVIHGHGGSRLHTGVNRRCVQGKSAPAADPDDADAFRIHIVLHGEEIDRRLKILRVDIRGCHVSGLTAALAGEGRIESQRQESALCHGLRIQAGALFLDRAERSAHGNGRQSSLCCLRSIHIGRQRDAVTVHKCHLPVIHLFTFRERLVPCFRQLKCFCLHHMSVLPFAG